MPSSGPGASTCSTADPPPAHRRSVVSPVAPDAGASRSPARRRPPLRGRTTSATSSCMSSTWAARPGIGGRRSGSQVARSWSEDNGASSGSSDRMRCFEGGRGVTVILTERATERVGPTDRPAAGVSGMALVQDQAPGSGVQGCLTCGELGLFQPVDVPAGERHRLPTSSEERREAGTVRAGACEGRAVLLRQPHACPGSEFGRRVLAGRLLQAPPVPERPNTSPPAGRVPSAVTRRRTPVPLRSTMRRPYAVPLTPGAAGASRATAATGRPGAHRARPPRAGPPQPRHHPRTTPRRRLATVGPHDVQEHRPWGNRADDHGADDKAYRKALEEARGSGGRGAGPGDPISGPPWPRAGSTTRKAKPTSPSTVCSTSGRPRGSPRSSAQFHREDTGDPHQRGLPGFGREIPGARPSPGGRAPAEEGTLVRGAAMRGVDDVHADERDEPTAQAPLGVTTLLAAVRAALGFKGVGPARTSRVRGAVPS